MNTYRTAARPAAVATIVATLAVGAACSSSSTSATPSPTNATAPTAPTAPTSQGASQVSASVLAPLHGHYSPTIDPAGFVGTVDNRYWPLIPGTGFHYRGVRGTTAQTDDEIVLSRTKTILGIRSTVVRDTVSEHGRAVERTYDYYAQDTAGNVWYMGELALERNAQGRMVKASDSWLAGVDGGQPGIIMPSDPRPGDGYRQEYYPPGEALDEARVLSLHGSETVPYGHFTHVLVTSEYSPLEPQTEQKYYAPGVGEISEKVVTGHHEAFVLVNVTHGP